MKLGWLLVFAFCLCAVHLAQCCKEGQLIKAPHSCDEYDECIDNSLVRKKCQLGHYFDGENCKHFLNVECNAEPCVEGMVYERGACAHSYDVCFEGKLREEVCPPLYKYDGAECVPMETCKVRQTCTEGEVKDVEGATYKECVNGNFENKKCELGYIFNKDTKSCWQPKMAFQSQLLKLNFCTEADRRSVGDCTKYQECVRGSFEDRQCSNGMLFDITTLTCRFKWEATCANGSCVEGMLTPNLNDCSRYYSCSAGEKKQENCGWLKHFDPVNQECTFSNHCDRKRCTGEWVKISSDCKKYTMCKNRYELSYECGIFNVFSNGACRFNAKCTQPNAFLSLINMEDGCITNQTQRIHGRCSEYQKCINNKWKIMKCPKGTNFQTDQCENKPCPLRPVLNHCNKFREPEKETIHECDFGYLFDKVERQCVHTAAARCAIGECLDKQVLSHPTDCNKYKVCEDAKWNIKSCPMLFPHFDSLTKTCKFYKYTCHYDSDNCTTNAIRSDPTDCKHYEMCVDHYWKTNKCWFWQHFDSVTNQCRTFNYKCSEPSKQDVAAVETKPVLRVPKKYGALVSSRTEQLLFGKCNEGEVKPMKDTCRWYTQCVNGEFITKRCSACQNFNTDTNKCEYVWKKPCDPSVTDPPDFTTVTPAPPTPPPTTQKPECKGGDKRGVKGDCKAYDECTNGKWVRTSCRVWGKFDEDTKQCLYMQWWKAKCAK